MRKVKRTLAAASVGMIACVGLVTAATTSSLVPTAAGNYSQWTPSSGSTHYTLVDETTCNGATDYVRTTTVGKRDSFAVTISSIPTGSKITQIDIIPCASNNTGGAGSTMNVFYRLNGVNSADAGSYVLSGTTPTSLATTSFSSLSAVKDGSTTLEIGAVYSAGTKGVRLSKIATVLTYSLLSDPTALSAVYAAGQINLAWTDNAAVEDGFKIERSIDGGAYSQIDTVLANVTTYADTTVTDDHTYSYKVRAYNSAADSGYSNVAATKTLPNAPSGLGAVPTGTNVALTWTDNSAIEDGFKLERSTDGINFTQFKIVAANATSTTATGGVVNTTYTFRIRAYATTGNSAYSAVATASTTPNAPSALSASYSASTVNLSWTDTAAVEDGFKIERSIDGGAYSQIDTVLANVTTYADTTVTDDHTYSYKVRAYNSAADSGYSNVAATKTLPNAPSGLGAVPTGTNVALTWTDNSAIEDGFKLERSTDGINFTQFKIVAANATSTTATGGVVNTTYTFRIRAYATTGNSAYSAVATASTTPNAPSALSASYSASTVNLSWTDTAAVEDGFKIERSIDGGAYAQIDTVLANVTTYADTTVTADHDYSYRVRAHNTAGNSAYTFSASTHTYTTVPTDPTGLILTLSGSTAIRLDWTDNSSNEKTFSIERKSGTGSFSLITTVNKNITTYTNKFLSPATTYTFRVKAVNPFGSSGYTVEESLTTP